MSTPSRELLPWPDHPAKYSKEIIPVLSNQVDDHVASHAMRSPYRILDPFAGVGGIHRLLDYGGVTSTRHTHPNTAFVVIGNELEHNWAIQGEGPMVQGDALCLAFPEERIDAVVTSPCYGNRMADHHEAKDPCSECDGKGRWPTERKLFNGQTLKEEAVCKKCKGNGLSARNTYRHKYGEPLRSESAAIMQWGLEYRNFHYEAWQEVWRVLDWGGLFICNVSNHIRKGEEINVVGWHHETILGIGFGSEDFIRVPTKRNGQGDNGKVRVDHEAVLVYSKLRAA